MFPRRLFPNLLATLLVTNTVTALPKETSLLTGKPIGDLAVAGRLSVDLHARFMLSREYGTERALNWFNCGYSGGGAGGSTVGGNFGDFGMQVPFEQRTHSYPLAVSTQGVPAVRFDGSDFLLGNVAIEPAILKSRRLAIEVWFRSSEGGSGGQTLLGWQSTDGTDTSAPLILPATLPAASGWRHLVLNIDNGRETWWLDGKKWGTRPSSLLPQTNHRLVLGGASSRQPSFAGDLAAFRLHDQMMAEDEILHNFKGGVMLGTDLKHWWRTEPDQWWILDTPHFRHAVDRAEMSKWSVEKKKAFDARLGEMVELAELCYHVYSERLAMRSSVVSFRPEDRGDGIKYRTPIQPATGSWMGWDGRFGWGCQDSGFINPHELVHGCQAMTGQMAGQFWEAHANFPQTYLGIYQTIPVISYEIPCFPANGRSFYHDRGFFEHLAQTPAYGPMFVAKLWYDGPTAENKHPLPWQSFEALNPYPDRTLGREITRTAMRNVTWDYTTFRPFKSGVGYQDGMPTAHNVYRQFAEQHYGKPHQAWWRGRTLLEAIPHEPTWWRVPKAQAPQQLGYNICPLAFKPGSITAELQGYVSAERGGDWHAGFVGVKPDGSPVYGEIFRVGQTASFQAGPELAELYLVVAATPTKILDFPMTSDFRSFEQEPFPWKVRLSGCSPRDVLWSEPPGEEGTRHPHGGGFVARTATVEATAWVGPDARVLGTSQVLGQARIEGRAVILDSIVRDHAVVSNRALVMGRSTISGRARVRDTAVVKESTTITDDARVLEHAVMLSRGVAGGLVTVKGLSSIYGGNQAGTALLDGSYAKANHIRQGKWFTWSWNFGQNPGEEDRDFGGLYADYTFDKPHAWMARDDHGVTWGYLVNSPGVVSRQDSLAEGTQDWALALDGRSQFVELPKDVADFHQATYTVTFAWDGRNERARVFEFSHPDGGLMALTPSVNGKMIITIQHDGKTETLTAPAVEPSQWTTVRVVLAAPRAILQVNGRTVDQATHFTLRPEHLGATRCYLGRGSTGDFFGGAIGRFTVHLAALVEQEPPSPNPAGFELAPTFVAPNVVAMVALRGEDPLGGVEYFFEEESGLWNSGWTAERVIRLEGRDVTQKWLYRVRMRDRNGNETGWSAPVRSGGPPANSSVHRVGPGTHAVIEAEAYHRVTHPADGNTTWKVETHGEGFVGACFVAVPDTGRRNDPFSVHAERLDYQLRFEKTGRHVLWVRASGNNDGGQFIHAGLGGVVGDWGLKVRTGYGRYTWTRLPDFKIAQPGDHLLSLWMCEDGAMIDRLIVTADLNFEPDPKSKEADGLMTGPGPAATRATLAP